MTQHQQNTLTDTVEIISGYNIKVQCYIRLLGDILNTSNHAWTIQKLECMGALADGMERLAADIETKCTDIYDYVINCSRRKPNHKR